MKFIILLIRSCCTAFYASLTASFKLLAILNLLFFCKVACKELFLFQWVGLGTIMQRMLRSINGSNLR